jgi:hypothetical protein
MKSMKVSDLDGKINRDENNIGNQTFSLHIFEALI